MNQLRFLNQIVVLTGAASGIGRAAARLFAKEGAIQFLLDIDQPGLEETLEGLEKKENAFTRQIDVRNPGDVKKAVEVAIDAYGRIDVLICDAGVVRIGEIENL